MLLLTCLIKAISIGFAIAAPIGPVGILCIQETLEQGLKGAIYVGIGATVANALFGFIAASGLTAITGFMLKSGVYLKLFGGAFLLFLAWKEFVAVTNKQFNIESCVRPGFVKLSLKSFFLIITNPVVILSFLSIFAALSGNAAVRTSYASLVILLGVALGSMIWWLLLGYIITSIKSRLPKIWLTRIQYFSAGIIVLIGVLTIASIFWQSLIMLASFKILFILPIFCRINGARTYST
jgi:threonine/homoserine/homoserine lactone efflux protein